MAQYSTGTIDITAGTNVVTGTGTLWAANAHAGDMISMDGGEFFVIASVDSDTQLTLSANYPATLDDVAYLIVSDFTPNKGLPLINQGDLQGADIVRRALQMIDSDIANTAYDQFAYDSELTSGLDLYLSAGRVRVGGVVTAIAAGAVTLTDDATNYIEIDAQAGTIVDNTTGFAANNIPLYTAVTAGGAITTVTDRRSAFAPRSVRICPVANIASPTAAELGNGTTQGDLILAYQAAGSAANNATLYMWDTSSAAEAKPYIVAATGGSWIAIGGRYSQLAYNIAGSIGGSYGVFSQTGVGLYLFGSVQIRNKANTGYLNWMTRDTSGAEVQTHLEYVGKINGAIREQGGTCCLNTLDGWKTIAKFTLADVARVGFHGVLICNDFGTYPGQRVDFAGGAYRSGTTVWFKWGASAIGLMDLTTALRVQKIDGEYAYEIQIRNPGASGAWTQMAWKIGHVDSSGETYSTRTVYSTPQAAGTSDASQASISANHKVCVPVGSFSSSVYAPIFYPYAGSADLILQLRNDSYDFSFRNTAGSEVARVTSAGVHNFKGGHTDVIYYADLLAASAAGIGAQTPWDNGTVSSFSAQPDVPRCIKVGVSGGNTPASGGTITINGLDADGATIAEVITVPGDAATWTDTTDKAFAWVTSVVAASFTGGPFWGTTLNIGWSDIVGIPNYPLNATTDVFKVKKNNANITVPTVVAAYGTVNCATISNGDDFTFWVRPYKQ